jgi:hypothetical protein
MLLLAPQYTEAASDHVQMDVAAKSIMCTQSTFQAGSFGSIRSLFMFMFFVLVRMQQREPPQPLSCQCGIYSYHALIWSIQRQAYRAINGQYCTKGIGNIRETNPSHTEIRPSRPPVAMEQPREIAPPLSPTAPCPEGGTTMLPVLPA